ncbi:MFS family permease [Kineosphaera limosa]|uniref:Putative major facilitator superfamily transporter n=1 Tax=Kineosphaera limosa NBRC 100340 TaxID=1184609 RepID=K6VNT4_9MICO|nr:MFS transporter [Kineosphaera limosa]NYD99624.1 MFS family permease [Kineosphaera limosa]GAB97863.1 putative major facilitator superfamily transporter [Kineosphaera limosa NBRC 100340]
MSARTPSPTFRSFVARNYRLFFAGALVNNVGTWMGRTAQAWLVLTELTDHDAAALGIVTALQFLPVLMLVGVSGVIADRFPKRVVLSCTQAGLAIVQAATAALVLTGTATLPVIYLLTFLYGVAAAIDAPARQAFVSEVVGPDLLSNAVGLNSANFNTARMIGPALAGLLIAVLGTGWVFVIDAVSVAAMIVCLWVMDPRALRPSPQRRGRGGVREGLAYVAGRPDIILILVVVFVHGTFGMNFQITTALMATTVFEKGPGEFGLLGSIMAVGSLWAALLTARRAQPRLAVVLGGLAAFVVASLAAALAPNYWTFAILLVPVGLTAMTILPTANSLVQLAVEPAMRGRVMALYLAIFMGGTPLGAPLIGWIGATWGARWTILVGSIADGLLLVGILVYLVRRHPDLLARRLPRLRLLTQMVRYGRIDVAGNRPAQQEVDSDEPALPADDRAGGVGGDAARRGPRSASVGAAQGRCSTTASTQATSARTSSGCTAG